MDNKTHIPPSNVVAVRGDDEGPGPTALNARTRTS